ncbi:hypothetical protein [uncultured Pseudokineococcus sp.]|uniref:hypothetical protein n=1 Tax=uncultured Pseudokineococcus sp. TaxID=1642928 RepID=UPI002623F6DE|nr:hypothetical protein [uncultured Pseudokineococcus sp.]
MSRDATGGRDMTGRDMTGRAAPGVPGGAPAPATELDDPAAGGSDGEGDDVARAPAGRRPRPGWRGALAVLVAAALGAGVALLAVRAQEAADVRLLLVSAFPDLDGTGDDGLALDLRVVGLGAQDAVVLGGGTGPPGEGVAGSVEVGGRARVPSDRAGEALVVPAGGVGAFVLRLEASCEAPPDWRPWLRVRTDGGGARVVALQSPEGAEGPAQDVLTSACELRRRTALEPVRVVGHGLEEGGRAVGIALENTSDVAYRLRVLGGGGISGVALPDGQAELRPGVTTSVVLAVDPPRCAGALRVGDLTSDAGLLAQRTAGDDADGPPLVPVDLSSAATEVALAVGRACAPPLDPSRAARTSS